MRFLCVFCVKSTEPSHTAWGQPAAYTVNIWTGYVTKK